MAPHELRRPFKRPVISDQQKRRDLSLLRQTQNRRDAQRQARCLASTVLSLQSQGSEPTSEPEPSVEPEPENQTSDLDFRQAAKLRGAEARRWFARQLMLPEWMIDIPDNLSHDWLLITRDLKKFIYLIIQTGMCIVVMQTINAGMQIKMNRLQDLPARTLLYSHLSSVKALLLADKSASLLAFLEIYEIPAVDGVPDFL